MTLACETLKGIASEVEAERELKRRRMGADEAFKPYARTIYMEKSGGKYVAIYDPDDEPKKALRILGLTPATAIANLLLLMEQKGLLPQ